MIGGRRGDSIAHIFRNLISHMFTLLQMKMNMWKKVEMCDISYTYKIRLCNFCIRVSVHL
jgi:hypothetical protein